MKKDAQMQIMTIPTGAYEVNCYAVWNEPEAALLIDPGADADEIIDAVESRGLSVAAVLCTHGHADHISALGQILEKYPVAARMAAADAVWAFTQLNAIPPYYASISRPHGVCEIAADGELVEAGSLRLRAMATPGHSPGSVCFVCDEACAVFSGDTLFERSIGRTDFPGGNPAAMRRSLARLMELPDDFTVYPGHGGATTIGAELRANPYIAR